MPILWPAIGFVIAPPMNEYSARYYLDKSSMCHNPINWPNNPRQISRTWSFRGRWSGPCSGTFEAGCEQCYASYEEMLNEMSGKCLWWIKAGPDPWLARINLPVAFIPNGIGKLICIICSLFMSLRGDPHAQYEIQVYVRALKKLYKNGCTFFTTKHTKNVVCTVPTFPEAAWRSWKTTYKSREQVTQESSGMSAREWSETMAEKLGRGFVNLVKLYSVPLIETLLWAMTSKDFGRESFRCAERGVFEPPWIDHRGPHPGIFWIGFPMHQFLGTGTSLSRIPEQMRTNTGGALIEMLSSKPITGSGLFFKVHSNKSSCIRNMTQKWRAQYCPNSNEEQLFPFFAGSTCKNSLTWKGANSVWKHGLFPPEHESLGRIRKWEILVLKISDFSYMFIIEKI